MSDADRSRQPRGIPAGGQFAAGQRAETDASLAMEREPTTQDVAGVFGAELDELERRWRHEADTERVFNTQIADLAQRVVDACADDVPERADLVKMVGRFREDGCEDDDVAEEVIYQMQDVLRSRGGAGAAGGSAAHRPA